VEPATIGARLNARDDESFVGRDAELEAVSGVLSERSVRSVVLIHGPGGVGKSTLARALARNGRSRGWTPCFLEGRDFGPCPGELELALAPARGCERPLVIIDSFEHLAASGVLLRDELLPSLPEHAITVLVSRGAPEAEWFTGRWAPRSIDVPLGPLKHDDSVDLLRHMGLTDPVRTEAIAAWSAGHPLSLSLAGAQALRDPGFDPRTELAEANHLQLLAERLVRTEADAMFGPVLAVAAIARVTTEDLLRSVSPEIDAAAALRWLAQRSFSERLGDGLTLHDLVRRAIRADLSRNHPALDQALRKRVADHLHERAVAGEVWLTIDLADLVTTPAIRAGFAWDGSATLRIDAPRPGDWEVIEQQARNGDPDSWWSLPGPDPDWLEGTRRFLAEAPERVQVVRDLTGKLCGYNIVVTPANAPAFAFDDPLLGPWLAHARETLHHDDVFLARDAADFLRVDDAARAFPVQPVLSLAAVLGSGLTNPRCTYAAVNPRNELAAAFAAQLRVSSIDARAIPDLGITVGATQLECWCIDYGSGGLLTAQRDLVYQELGLPLPSNTVAIPADADAQAVHSALRNFHSPMLLARSPLAVGPTPAARADHVRRVITDATELAFGASPDERTLRTILQRGYLDPVITHEQVLGELGVSRSTYFRKLKIAAQRVADVVVGGSVAA